jgi:hypothetical protein
MRIHGGPAQSASLGCDSQKSTECSKGVILSDAGCDLPYLTHWVQDCCHLCPRQDWQAVVIQSCFGSGVVDTYCLMVAGTVQHSLALTRRIGCLPYDPAHCLL